MNKIKGDFIMTLLEVSEKLGYSPNTIKRSLARTQESLKKNRGILLIKNGFDDYELKYNESLIEPKESKIQKHTIFWCPSSISATGWQVLCLVFWWEPFFPSTPRVSISR